MFSDHFWNMVNRCFGVMCLAAVMLLALFTASIEIKDFDLWLHYGMGRFILEHGYVPFIDVLSNSVYGEPWANHQWLFQVIVAKIHAWVGFNGLIYMQMSVVFVSLMILVTTFYRKNYQLMSAGMLLLVVMVYQQRFTIRPDIYSILFLITYIAVALKGIRYRWSIYVIFLVQIFWVNIHGLSFLGHGVLTIFIIAEFIKRRFPLPYEWQQTDLLSNKAYFNLKLALLFSILGSIGNPLFIEGAWGPIHYILFGQGDSKEFFNYITELKKPFLWVDFFDFSVQRYYKLTIIASVLAVVLNRKRLNLGLVGVGLFMFVFSQVAVRNLIYFAVTAYVLVLWHFMKVDWKTWAPIKFNSYRAQQFIDFLLKIILIFWIMNYAINISDRGYFDFDTQKRKSEYLGVTKRSFPHHAVDFLVENHIHGRFWNGFNAGAYLVGRTFPYIKVYIDGRTEPYGFEHFKKYLAVWKDGDESMFDQEVNRYGLTGVLLDGHYQDIPEDVIKMLSQKEEWKLVYFDYDGLIFLKDVPQNQRWIDQYLIDFAEWQSPTHTLYEYGIKRITPYPFIKRARILRILGEDELALEEVAQAIRINPAYADSYYERGQIYHKNKQYDKAYEDYRLSAVLGGGDMYSRRHIVQALFHLKKYDKAVEQVSLLIEEYPDAAFHWYLLARIQIGQDLFNDGWRSIQKAMALDIKNHSDDIITLTNEVLLKNNHVLAENILVEAYNADKSNKKIISRLIKFYQENGNNEQVKLFQGILSDLE